MLDLVLIWTWNMAQSLAFADTEAFESEWVTRIQPLNKPPGNAASNLRPKKPGSTWDLHAAAVLTVAYRCWKRKNIIPTAGNTQSQATMPPMPCGAGRPSQTTVTAGRLPAGTLQLAALELGSEGSGRAARQRPAGSAEPAPVERLLSTLGPAPLGVGWSSGGMSAPMLR